MTPSIRGRDQRSEAGSRSAGVLLMSAVRVLRSIAYLRLRGVHHGPLPHLRGMLPRIAADGELRVGRRFRVDGVIVRNSFTVRRGATLRIGDDVYFNRGSSVHAACRVTIGDNVLVGDMTTISDNDFHPVEAGRPATVAPVAIGDNVWLASRVTVLPGVEIGRHSVVATGSVVTRSVPEAVLVEGNPARVIRSLDIPAGWIRPQREASR